MGLRRTILLVVSGMSPQVITETLYVLIQENRVPDEVRLITTERGRQNAVLQLLEGDRHFFRLLADYKVSHRVHFNEQSITVVRDARGRPLSDIRTPEDNEAAADTICSIVRELTRDDHTELHVSLAGGRKTMGFYAGYALSLFGRPQDCLSHVLVSELYESNRDFFYPSPKRRVIHAADGSVLDASAAKVWLARIPFVRMRDRLPEILLTGKHSFSETVRLAREATEPVELAVSPFERTYRINHCHGKLSPLNTALLTWMVTRALEGSPPIEPLIDGETRPADDLLSLAERYWLELQPRTETLLRKEGITQHWLEQNVSRLNKTIEASVGPELASRCKLASRQFGRRRGYAFPDGLELRIETEVGSPQPGLHG